jgi:hypothetical protein
MQPGFAFGVALAMQPVLQGSEVFMNERKWLIQRLFGI